MKTANLHLLTRIHESESVSLLLTALSGRRDLKTMSSHEAASLWSLTDELTDYFKQASTVEPSEVSSKWLSYFDGFFISYVIEHIGKEFDLLKVSADGDAVLNIELKSEDIGEDRIKRQLEQNRYYLAHIAHSICSFTYVMDTHTFYCLNDRGFLRKSSAAELGEVMKRGVFRDFLSEGLNRFFRASDYLISPVGSPEKFLQGQYFLTNQQFDFRRRILEHLHENDHPVISISGIAGTGKTLLLFDLAMQLSRKETVLLVHSGPLRKGHLVINERLKKVSICPHKKTASAEAISKYDYLLIDEADHLNTAELRSYLDAAAAEDIPVILTCDPHHLISEQYGDDEASGTMELIYETSTLSLTFSGNIRINRPVYAFLRTLLNLKDHAGHPDYSCIDVLYANNPEELKLITDYCRSRGYELISSNGSTEEAETVIAQEYAKVLMILDDSWYYDDSMHLKSKDGTGRSLQLLYEGLSRTRENLCLIISGNRTLFEQIMEIRLQLFLATR